MVRPRLHGMVKAERLPERGPDDAPVMRGEAIDCGEGSLEPPPLLHCSWVWTSRGDTP